MEKIKLYPAFENASFIERDNRFVTTLKKDGQLIKAYVANPGRMEEFLVKDHPFYITSGNNGKYFYRIVATSYRDSYVLLDTIKINHIAELMLQNDLIDEFKGEKRVRREVAVNRSKFDFKIEREGKKPVLLEIKSCSLCHKGVGMFPDAPTTRGKRHLEDLDQLALQGYDTYTLYLTTNRHTRVFIPNGHTDPDYCTAFNKSHNVKFLAYAVEFIDPVTLDLSHVHKLTIDFEKAREICRDRGSYLVILYNEKPFKKEIGSLGEREFKEGFYIYAGSAMKGLESRIKRHMRKSKKRHWHMDYITPSRMKVVKVYRIRRAERLEERLARGLLEICDDHVPGFGASDTGMDSHLFYFTDRPHRRRNFLDLLLDFQLFAN
ncbi:MAG: DNA/RNA nuclease SfsA [bacterium]|nr:DNA/RNA nuclease SfsA [bacterium]